VDFTIKRIDLLAAIDKCAIAVPGDHQNSAFNVVRVEGKGKKKVKLSVVGERAAVDTVVEAEVKEPGFFNVLPKRLRDIAASMPDGKVQFSLKGTRVTVKSGAGSRRATFESHLVDLFSVDDPGRDAPWITVDAKELERALRLIKPMAASRFSDALSVSLLIATERGLDVFGCNDHLIGLIETSIRVDSKETIQVPAQAAEVLFKMTDIDENVRLLMTPSRVYLENCDTLVSAALPAKYTYETTYPMFIGYLKGTDGNKRIAGPTFDPALMKSGVRSVLALGGFANKDERDKGMNVHLHLGSDTVKIELALGIADAKDEFGVVSSEGELTSVVDSGYLLSILGSLDASTQVKAYHTHDDLMLVLQSQGIAVGLMKKVTT